MERLYKGFGFMQNHFHPQHQQRRYFLQPSRTEHQRTDKSFT
ncbi:MAG TPA: hypothetical protein VK184_09640 [Nostocaceae cyanobacterium]|nr:hypothetical protein [Nostocaceae cyanobacterium]